MNARAFDPNGPDVKKLRRQMLSKTNLRGFMASKLPLALMAGLKVTHLDASSCKTTVRYGWRTTNPFKSTYFAALAMAAEMSTGALGLSLVQAAPEPVSILITGMTAEFVKKATDLTTFTCGDGAALQDAVVETLQSGEGTTCVATSTGTNQAGEVVARFTFTWSFKKKGSKR
ncbi:MAG: PaaI family thioesterase [Myxococcota bacterium]